MPATLATTATHTGTRPTAAWIGVILTALPVLFLIFDGAIKLIVIGPVVTAFGELGYPVSMAPAIGTLEIVCLALYLVPRSSVLGAILLTGFLGGAVASHARLQDPLLTHTIFPVYIGLMIWVGLVLRDTELRSFLLRRLKA